MRKVFSGIIALFMLLTMFTGCKKDDDSSGSSLTQTTTAAEKDINNVTSDETSVTSAQEEDSQTEQSDSPRGKTEISGNYEAALREFFQATNQNDYDKIIRAMYPSKVIDAIYTLYKSQDDLEKAFGTNDSDAAYEITDIIEESAMTNEELTELKSNFDQLIAMAELLKTYGDGLKSMSAEEREKIYQSMLEAAGEASARPYTITEGYNVTVRSLRKGETEADYFFVYYIQGEGWRFDNSLRKYIMKSKQSVANSTAKKVFNVYRSEFEDLNKDDVDVKGAYIIGSDDTMTTTVPASVNVAAVRESAEKAFNELADYDYFVIIQNGVCVYSAIYKKDKTGCLATYPFSCVPKSLRDDGLQTDNLAEAGNYSLKELYQVAKKAIK